MLLLGRVGFTHIEDFFFKACVVKKKKRREKKKRTFKSYWKRPLILRSMLFVFEARYYSSLLGWNSLPKEVESFHHSLPGICSKNGLSFNRGNREPMVTGRSLKWEKQVWGKTKGRDEKCGTWQDLPIKRHFKKLTNTLWAKGVLPGG